MNQRISGFWGRIVALGLLPQTVIGIVLSAAAADAGMENARFALHYKPKFVASKQVPYLCDNLATVTVEKNYSPNYTNTPCDQYSVACEPFGPGQVYVVIGKAGAEGVAAASFGISYGGSSHTGIDPAWVTWTPCADGLQFPNSDGVHGDFPQPGGGLRITWNNATSCQTQVIGIMGVHAIVGVFYVYAYSNDILRVTPNYNFSSGGPELGIGNCAGVTTNLVDVWGLQNVLQYVVGSVGFNEYGFNPCWIINSTSHQAASAPCTVPATPTTWGKMKSKYKSNQ